MKFEFEAYAGGDGECFTFIVDKETFIRLMGIEEYNNEIEYRKEFHNEMFSGPGADPFVEPTEWPIYPNQFFKNRMRIKIETDEL